MEILKDKVLLIRTRYPERITETVNGSKKLGAAEDISVVAVDWDLSTAQSLAKLKFKNVPSPINRDYDWPGQFKPMQHQKDTAAFLTLHQRAFCFNEQGTGKTAAAIWASDYLIRCGVIKRVLVICPLSIMQSAWHTDLFRFATHRSAAVAYGTRDKRRAVIEGSYEYVIINYDGVEVVSDTLRSNNFDLIIIDEANAYKNVTTKRWKTMKSLVGDKTWIWMMTGTPAAQSPADAYGLAKLCVPERVPRFFGAFRDMVMQNITRFKWVPKPCANKTVFATLQPAIRFTKEECLDLPELTYVEREAPLSPQQEKYYKQLKKEMLISAAGEEVSTANAASNLNKLLQISGGAVYTDTGAVVEFDVSNRLKAVLEVIEEASHKVLVFVPFRHTILLLQDFLDKNGVSNDIISGDVSAQSRTRIFNKFQTETNPKVLIIQPQAAAHGVTLTAANVVIWYSPVTSIETYLQANARINRKGQKNVMTVVHVQGSAVERRLYQMLSNKLDHHTRLTDLYKNEISS